MFTLQFPTTEPLTDGGKQKLGFETAGTWQSAFPDLALFS